MIFKEVREGRPYPDHGFSARDWARIPPHQVRLDTLITTKRQLGLDTLLADDSTFYGDLFPHAVQWKGELYLEDGLHRCLRAALQQRTAVHVRVLNLDEISGFGSNSDNAAGAAATAAPAAAGSPKAAGSGASAGAAVTADPAPAGPAAPAGEERRADGDSPGETAAG